MTKCPRCGKNELLSDSVLNSRSHTGNHEGVEICNDCGTNEALLLQGMLDDVDEKIIQIKWENTH